MTRAAPLRRTVGLILAAVMLLTSAAPFSAVAGIVPTEEVIAAQRAELDRARLMTELERAGVQEQLERYGVVPAEARERVAAMTDEEVRELADGIHQQPVGAGVGTVTLLLVIIILILLVR